MTQPADRSQQARKAYEDAEKRTATMMEQVVSSEGFAEGLALFTGNLVALSKAASLGIDQLVRATRLAGRGDVARLGRQIGRTEDKLEQVLQAVERLEEELEATRAERDAALAANDGAQPPSVARNGARTGRSAAGRRTTSAAFPGEGPAEGER